MAALLSHWGHGIDECSYLGIGIAYHTCEVWPHRLKRDLTREVIHPLLKWVIVEFVIVDYCYQYYSLNLMFLMLLITLVVVIGKTASVCCWSQITKVLSYQICLIIDWILKMWNREYGDILYWCGLMHGRITTQVVLLECRVTTL